MKTIAIYITALVVAALTPLGVSAQSVFEITNLPETINTAIGQETKTYISFKYMGGTSKPSVSVQGDVLPAGLALSPIEYGPQGVNTVKYSGVPTTAGEFPLKLVFLDGNGQTVTKNFTVKVGGFALTTTKLPAAVAGKKYSTKIAFTYPGTTAVPLMRITDITQDSYINVAYMNINASGGAFLLEMNPVKTGTFSFKGTVSINDIKVATQNFTINVVATDAQAKALTGSTPATKTTTATAPKATSSAKATTTDSTREESTTTEEALEEEMSWFEKLLNFFRNLFS